MLHSWQARVHQTAGKFVCFPDVEKAKTLIKRFRKEDYTYHDSVERYLPPWEFVFLYPHLWLSFFQMNDGTA
jgi:hypothetical protein